MGTNFTGLHGGRTAGTRGAIGTERLAFSPESGSHPPVLNTTQTGTGIDDRVLAASTRLPMTPDQYNARAWEIDLAKQRVTHVSGFSARVCELPLTETELRDLNAQGLVAVGTVRADNGVRWAVLAASEAIARVERWADGESLHGTARDRAITAIARDAARAWLELSMPPPTVDEPLRPMSRAAR